MRDSNYDLLHSEVILAPRLVWDRLLEHLRRWPRQDSSIELIEDLVVWHGDKCMDAIETAAVSDPHIAETVLACRVRGNTDATAERFKALQERLAWVASRADTVPSSRRVTPVGRRPPRPA